MFLSNRDVRGAASRARYVQRFGAVALRPRSALRRSALARAARPERQRKGLIKKSGIFTLRVRLRFIPPLHVIVAALEHAYPSTEQVHGAKTSLPLFCARQRLSDPHAPPPPSSGCFLHRTEAGCASSLLHVTIRLYSHLVFSFLVALTSFFPSPFSSSAAHGRVNCYWKS
jgi:hypothetical protein